MKEGDKVRMKNIMPSSDASVRASFISTVKAVGWYDGKLAACLQHEDFIEIYDVEDLVIVPVECIVPDSHKHPFEKG